MYSRAFQGREKTSLEQDHGQNRGISLVDTRERWSRNIVLHLKFLN